MSLWITVSLAAAVFQTARFMLQKMLATNTLSAAGATLARFFYSAPLVVISVLSYLQFSELRLPVLPWAFWGYATLGGFAQVMATICVVMVFKARNFAVGVTLAKTETMLSVATGALILGDVVSGVALGAIVLGVVGVVLLSVPPNQEAWRLRDLCNEAAGLGLASGFLFAISAICYRGASLQVGFEQPFLRAGVTLAAVTSLQLIGMLLWLGWRDPSQISAVWNARRVAGWIGLLSMAGSFCWFWAFTLQNVAYVKAVGQVELILSMALTLFFFKEKITPREWIGGSVLSLSVLAMILFV